jgi:hypothetical protein
MGLFLIRAKFEGEPPTEQTFRAELLRELGDISGLEGFDVDGKLVEVRTMMDATTYPYAIKVLLRLGGNYVDALTLEPREPKLPAFVERRWRDWSLWARARIRLGFLLSVFATALPKERAP